MNDRRGEGGKMNFLILVAKSSLESFLFKFLTLPFLRLLLSWNLSAPHNSKRRYPFITRFHVTFSSFTVHYPGKPLDQAKERMRTGAKLTAIFHQLIEFTRYPDKYSMACKIRPCLSVGKLSRVYLIPGATAASQPRGRIDRTSAINQT